MSTLQLSSDDAVKRVLAGEKVDVKTKASTSKSQDKENREGRERSQDKDVRVFFHLVDSKPMSLLWSCFLNPKKTQLK